MDREAVVSSAVGLMGLPADEKQLGRYMIELNILYRGGLRGIQGVSRSVQGSARRAARV